MCVSWLLGCWVKDDMIAVGGDFFHSIDSRGSEPCLQPEYLHGSD